MTTAAYNDRANKGRRLMRGLATGRALGGFFGFGIVSIALAQAAASLSPAHFNTIWQIALGVVGGALGAYFGAVSIASSDDRG